MTPDELLHRLAFVWPSHERSAELRSDAAALTEMLASDRARFLPVWSMKHPFLTGPDGATRPVVLNSTHDRDNAVFLGLLDGTPWFATGFDGEATPDVPGEFKSLIEALPFLSAADAALMVHARAMVIWHANHRHCGRCGARTQTMEGGHSITCTNDACGHRAFPRTDPAIITAVIHPDGEQILMGRQAVWPPGVYSTITGFVEPGESLEAAVAREVLEETGVHVDDVRYVTSQPWPFPSSIMLGFRCRATSTAIQRNDGELEDCRWFTRDAVKAGGTRGDPGSGLKLSHPYSISRYLIDTWAFEK